MVGRRWQTKTSVRMIQGVEIKDLIKYHDQRGWLAELFRTDEGYTPAMSYLSITKPGRARGPHEHRGQADYFCFLFSRFRLVLWDNRPSSDTYTAQWTMEVGEDNAVSVLVPKGVVHAYKNIGAGDGLVLNFPDKLYRGEGRRDVVDEIRHEEDSASEYVLP